MLCPRTRRALAQPVSGRRTAGVVFLASTVTAVHLLSASGPSRSGSFLRPVGLTHAERPSFPSELRETLVKTNAQWGGGWWGRRLEVHRRQELGGVRPRSPAWHTAGTWHRSPGPRPPPGRAAGARRTRAGRASTWWNPVTAGLTASTTEVPTAIRTQCANRRCNSSICGPCRGPQTNTRWEWSSGRTCARCGPAGRKPGVQPTSWSSPARSSSSRTRYSASTFPVVASPSREPTPTGPAITVTCRTAWVPGVP